jgi:hypothetical protein
MEPEAMTRAIEKALGKLGEPGETVPGEKIPPEAG